MSSTGQAVGAIVGATVGFFVGGPQGAVYGAQIGMTAGGMIDPPKGPTINGPRLSDLSAQTSTYGSPIPRIYGTVATHGNVIWLQGNQLTERVRKEKQGGKGGGGGATVKTYSYYATFAVGLADVSKTGPIQGVRRIWVGGNLIYDAGSDDLDTIISSNNSAQGFRIYNGSEDQQPDPRMQADVGVENCPAYRGLAYIVFYDFPLKDYGNSLMAAQVKVELVSILGAGYPYKISDISPMTGILVNVSDGITTTAQVYSETFSSGNYTGTVLFRDYSGGKIIRSRRVSASIEIGGVTPSTAFFKTCFIHGASGEMFVARTPFGNKLISFSFGIGSMAHDLDSIDQSNYYYKAKDGRRFFPSVSNFGVLGGSSFKYYTVAAGPHGAGQYQSVVFQQDKETSSLYMLRGTSNTAFCELVELNDDMGKISSWDFEFGFSAREFYINRNRLVIYDGSSSNRFYQKSGSSLVEIGAATPAGFHSRYFADGVVLINNSLFQVSDRIIGDTAPLSDIVKSECLQSGLLSDSDIDVSDLEQDVRGYRIAQTGAIRGALEPLQGAWPFDMIQSGYKIKFVRRGKTPVVTIDASQLDARQADSAPGVQITLANEMDTQLPRAVSLKYLDIGREYDLSEQNAERLNTDAVNLREMEMPIVLSATEAAGISEVLLYLYWLERRDVSFRLPPEYRYLEPADVITVTGEWGQYELRLTRINLESDGRLACYAKFNAAAIYTPTAQGAEGEAPPQTIPLDGPSVYIMLDVPLLSDGYNEPGWPAAMAGYTSGWPGGIIYRSVDGGQTWTDLQGFVSPVTMGYARGTLGSGRYDIVDASSIVDVDMLAGDLSSISESAQFAGGNAVAFGAPGRWEVCSPRTVTQNADGSLRMTDWLRGRFGTEWAASLHQPGDAMVLLTDPDLAWIGMDSASIGMPRDYRGITAGRSIDTDTNRSESYDGVNLKPLSPVYLNGSINPSTLDLALTWIRRGRVSPGWRNGVDVPIGEASESYEVDIYDGAGYTTIKRTLTATSATVAYTSAQQVTDFGGNQGTLYVRVYQMSATVGRGFPLSASITRG